MALEADDCVGRLSGGKSGASKPQIPFGFAQGRLFDYGSGLLRSGRHVILKDFLGLMGEMCPGFMEEMAEGLDWDFRFE